MPITNEINIRAPFLRKPGAPAPDKADEQLIRLNKLTSDQVARARAVQAQKGIGFVDAAVEIGAVDRHVLMSALAKQYNYPIIHSEADGGRFSSELVVGYEPFGAVAESIRSIRTSLVSSAVANATRSFAVIGPRPGAGNTFLAANLALAFAQMSVATLLVDANLRDPRIAEMFGFHRDQEGLSETLARKSIEQPYIVYDIIPRLSIMTSGAIPPNPQELVCSEEFLLLTNNLTKDFEIVIYDTPSAMDYADAYMLATRVDASIVVARKHKTNFSDITAVTNKLRSVQCNVVGAILNEF